MSKTGNRFLIAARGQEDTRCDKYFSTEAVHKVVENSLSFFSNELKDKKFAAFAQVLGDRMIRGERREP